MRDISLVLDKQIAKEFHKCAERTKEYPLDVGEMRKLIQFAGALRGSQNKADNTRLPPR